MKKISMLNLARFIFGKTICSTYHYQFYDFCCKRIKHRRVWGWNQILLLISTIFLVVCVILFAISCVIFVSDFWLLPSLNHLLPFSSWTDLQFNFAELTLCNFTYFDYFLTVIKFVIEFLDYIPHYGVKYRLITSKEYPIIENWNRFLYNTKQIRNWFLWLRIFLKIT